MDKNAARNRRDSACRLVGRPLVAVVRVWGRSRDVLLRSWVRKLAAVALPTPLAHAGRPATGELSAGVW
ncbi:MAG: hypothetical protein RJB61_2353 [Actinomycetota bacterium]|jgi:hypothetical protein